MYEPQNLQELAKQFAQWLEQNDTVDAALPNEVIQAEILKTLRIARQLKPDLAND